MSESVAIVGAGVSGLTTAIVFAERGYDVSILAEEVGQGTTSGVAAAIWFPYDAAPVDKVISWALETYKVLVELSDESPSTSAPQLDRLKRSSCESSVSMIELRQFRRDGEIQIPNWARSLGGSVTLHPVSVGLEVGTACVFKSGFSIQVPLMDTTIYLDYLRDRLTNARVAILGGIRFERLEDVDSKFNLVINCAGIGARELVHDADLEPHRGQVAIVPKINALDCAIVCDDAPLMYAIPRSIDCVFGGTNDVSDNLAADSETTEAIVAECSRVLNIETPRVLAERVGLRPFRKSGVRVESGKLSDGRTVIHNYGHGGAGFTLSWGCAENVFQIASR